MLLTAAVLCASRPAAAQPATPAPGAAGPVTVPTAGGDITILADRLEEVGPDRVLVATGNVEITRGGARLVADRVEINRQTGDAVAQGRVVFYDGEDQLVGQRIEYNLKTGTGIVYQAEGRTAPYYRISGEQMERVGPSVYRIRRGSFTTCEADPPAWSFHFGAATADLEDFVYGTNASFWVRNIPLIPFFPFFAAAIRRERQTGFLFPKFGNSSQKGFFTEVPFYWAISDSQDATIALDVYTNRGVGTTSEYRYVLGSASRGRLSGFVLQETERHDATRAVGSYRHDSTLAPGLVFKADVNGVSDDDVLRDYGDALLQRSSQRTESNIFLTRTWSTWNLVGNVFAYQDLTTRRPTELNRLPEISAQAVRQPVPGIPGLLYEVDAGFVHFVRDIGSDGSRFDLHPRLSRPFAPGGIVTVTPFVGGRLTAYDKTVVAFHRTHDVAPLIEVTEDEPRFRRLAEAGTDVEMRLSRIYPFEHWGYDALLHSIEPRVNYTGIVGEQQGRLPNWTAGVDRVPDTSLIQYSVTNRFRGRTVTLPGTEAMRWEVLRLLLGHGYDLKNDRLGDAFGTLIVRPTDKLRFRSDASYNVERDHIDSLTSDLSVVTPLGTASIGNRYSETGDVNFLQGAATADLARVLTVRLTTNWDLRTDTFVENRVAVDWRFQCWALTVEYVQRPRQEDEVRFAVNLLGVGAPLTTAVGLGALQSTGQK